MGPTKFAAVLCAALLACTSVHGASTAAGENGGSDRSERVLVSQSSCGTMLNEAKGTLPTAVPGGTCGAGIAVCPDDQWCVFFGSACVRARVIYIRANGVCACVHVCECECLQVFRILLGPLRTRSRQPELVRVSAGRTHSEAEARTHIYIYTQVHHTHTVAHTHTHTHSCSQYGRCQSHSCESTCQCSFSGKNSDCPGSPFLSMSSIPEAVPGEPCGPGVATCPEVCQAFVSLCVRTTLKCPSVYDGGARVPSSPR